MGCKLVKLWIRQKILLRYSVQCSLCSVQYKVYILNYFVVLFVEFTVFCTRMYILQCDMWYKKLISEHSHLFLQIIKKFYLHHVSICKFVIFILLNIVFFKTFYLLCNCALDIQGLWFDKCLPKTSIKTPPRAPSLGLQRLWFDVVIFDNF